MTQYLITVFFFFFFFYFLCDDCAFFVIIMTVIIVFFVITLTFYLMLIIFGFSIRDAPIRYSVSVSAPIRSFSAGSGIDQMRPIQIRYCAYTILCYC